MPKRLLFIHHSTGANLIHKGNLRKLLYAKTDRIEFWDHSYNVSENIPSSILKIVANKFTYKTGLSDKDGNILSKDFSIKLSNNDPGDFENIFCSAPTNSTLQQILQFDIIAFKNCYPTTKMESDEKLERFKQNYNNMSNCFKQYPDKLFIAFTPPPLRQELTKPEYAKRATEFASWINNKWMKPSNVRVFDFFSLLADSNGYLKKEYCPILKIDSHPNKQANEKIASIFTNFLVQLN